MIAEYEDRDWRFFLLLSVGRRYQSLSHFAPPIMCDISIIQGACVFSVIIKGFAVIILCHFRYFASYEPFEQTSGMIRDKARGRVSAHEYLLQRV